MDIRRTLIGIALVTAMAASAEGQTPEVSCGWGIVSDPDTVNVAYPDEAATYWASEVPSIPGTRVRIDGLVPDARYFSFHAYDPALRPIDGIADYEIAPVGDGSSPSPRPATAPGTPYTVYVSRAGLQLPREQNTLYAGDMPAAGATRVPNARINLLYRIYVAAAGAVPDGGVGLPRISVETEDGSTTLFALGDCGPVNPSTGSAVNEAVRTSNAPDEASLVPYPFAVLPPSFGRFYGLPDTARRLASAPVYQLTGESIPKSAATESSGGGFYSNVHNAYLTGAFSRNYGNLYVLRAKAPTFDGDPRLTSARPDLRYWSICTNDFPTQRFVGCLTDYQTERGPDGWFTIVVSDQADRPAGVGAGSGLNWLPWGGVYLDSLIIYRHMLPAADFAEAIQNVGYYEELADSMGDYAPSAVYCDPETIDAALASAPGNPGAAVFAACSAS